MARSWLVCIIALIMAVLAAAEPRKLLQTPQQQINDANQQLTQIQQQVNQVQANTVITPQCQNQVQTAQNQVVQANQQQGQVAQEAAGNAAEEAAWNPKDGGQQAAPWPFHSWPNSQQGSLSTAMLNAIDTQIQANQALLNAYGQC